MTIALIDVRLRKLIGRWILVRLDDETLGWTGARWAPILGQYQICNFETVDAATTFASHEGFNLVGIIESLEIDICNG